MKKNLLTLFITKLYDLLEEENLSFKEIKYANGHSYSLCPRTDIDALNIDLGFLLENIDNYFIDLSRSKDKSKNYLSRIFHSLLEQYPELVFSQLSSSLLVPEEISYVGSSSSPSSPVKISRRGIQSIIPSLKCMFEQEDLATYFINYKNKDLICKNYYDLKSTLEDIDNIFKNHSSYEDIVFHTLNLHKNLIKKSDKTLIYIRAWCLNNVKDISRFEDIVSVEDNTSLFDTPPLKTKLLFLNTKSVSAKFILQNSSISYSDLIKSVSSMLNYPLIKKELGIENVESNYAFKKKNYQLSFFSKEEVPTEKLENAINILFKCISNSYNNMSDKSSAKDFESNIFKAFQYNILNQKLTPSGKKQTITGKKI